MKSPKTHNPSPDRIRRRPEAFLEEFTQRIKSQEADFIPELFEELRLSLAEEEMEKKELRRRLSESEMEKSWDRYRALYEFAPASYLTLDAKGQILSANPAAADLLGMDRKRLINESFQSFVEEKDHSLFNSHLQRAIETGARQTFQLHIISTVGKVIYAQVEITALPDEEEKTSRLHCVLVDITEQKTTEERLSRSAEMFRTLADNIFEIVARFDRNLRYLYVNPAVEAVAGRSRDDFIGKTNAELDMPPLVSRLWDRVLKRVFRKGRVEEVEFDFPSPKGIRSLQGILTPQIDSHGQVESVLAAIRDVTAFKNATRKAEQRAKEMEAVFSALMDGVIICDTQGVIVKASNAALAMCKNLIGMTGTDLIRELCLRSPDGTPLIPEQLPIVRALKGDTVIGEQLLLTGSNGRDIIVLASASPVFLEAQLVGAITVTHNITELEKERTKLREVIENTPVAVVVADQKGRITMANKAAELLYGRQVPYDEGVETHLRLNLIHPDGQIYHPKDLPLSRSVFHGEKHRGVEMGIIWPNGQRRDLLVYTSPVYDLKGAVSGAVGAFMDITDRKGMEEELTIAKEILEERVRQRTSKLELEVVKRKRVEKALKASTQKVIRQHNRRRFLSKRLVELLEKDRRDVAVTLHDGVGQILTTLKMELEAAGLEVAHTSSEARLKRAQEKLSEIMRYVRDTSRKLRPTTLDTLGLVPSLRSLIDDIKDTSECPINFFSKGDFRHIGSGIELALYRISQEALTNIIKHASATDVFVSLIRRGDNINLSVEDDGVGFVYEKVMSSSHSAQGALGILIMRERAVHIGADFRIESQPGKGTQVMVEVPL